MKKSIELLQKEMEHFSEGQKFISDAIRDQKKSLRDLTDNLPAISNRVSEVQKEVFELKDDVNNNTEFRIGVDSNIKLMRWMIGAFGISNIVTFILLLAK